MTCLPDFQCKFLKAAVQSDLPTQRPLMSQPLSDEVLKRIEENKAKALAKLAAKRKREQEPATNEAAPAESKQNSADNDARGSKRRARWAKPIFEYDLSQMVDSRGGFLIDDDCGNGDDKKKFDEKAHKVDLNPRKLSIAGLAVDTLTVSHPQLQHVRLIQVKILNVQNVIHWISTHISIRFSRSTSAVPVKINTPTSIA